MKKSKGFMFVMTAIISCMLMNTCIVNASDHVPYETYNYNYRDYIVFTPAAYLPDSAINAADFGIGAFLNPQDLCISPVDNLIYVADTDKNRIVVFDSELTKVVKEITSFDNNGTIDSFKKPYGVAVSNSNQLYIADSENRRIVVLDPEGKLVKIVDNPENEVISEDYVFTPQKIVVDYADRIYCIAQGVTEGLMVFDADGKFQSYFGTIKVNITLWEKIWKSLSSKEQRSKQSLYIAPEFTGIDVDPSGFIYASNLDTNGIQAVKRLNPKGEDVIVKGTKKNLGGDIDFLSFSDYSGPSVMVDVTYRHDGIYSLLDSRRGRIFTYDSEGNLLYIFGGLGTQAGTFKKPVAIESIGEKIIVLDATRNEILIFNETIYGSLINEAISLRYSGDEAEAVDLWQQVLKLDENFELANVGIGKAYLAAGDNHQAMKYLKLGMSREYYSIAYKRYRNEVLKDNIGYVLTGIIVLIAGVSVTKMILRRRKKTYIDTDEGGGLE